MDVDPVAEIDAESVPDNNTLAGEIVEQPLALVILTL